MPTDEEMLDMAIDEALSGIRSGHGGPFGCVISKDGEVVALGHNMVLENNDPTAHGEVSAIRRACSILRTIDLSSCTLYTNSEPCPMCKAAISWAKVGKVVYAVTMRDANDVVLRAIFNAAKGAAANIMEVRLDGAPRVIENQNDGERVSTIFTQEELDDNYGLALMSLPGDGIPRADRDSLAALADSLGATPGAWFEMSLYKMRDIWWGDPMEKVDTGASEKLASIPVPISLSVDVPDELRKEGRTYYLLQSYEGKATQMAKGTGPALSWEGDRFSGCLLAFSEDGGSPEPISEKQDRSAAYLLLAVLTALAAVDMASVIARKG